MNKPLYILVISLMVVASCRKDDELSEVETGEATYEGTFLVDYVYDYNYSGQNSDNEKDVLMEVTRSKDTLFFNNHKFLIQEYGQESFTAIPTIGSSATVTLTYSNNFETISHYRHYPSDLSGPSVTVTCNGDKSALIDPENVHPYENDLIGQYELVFYQYNWADSVDTTYTEIVDVAMTRYNSTWSQSYTIHIDTLDFTVGEFITYNYDSGGYNSTHETENLFWNTDSFSFHYLYTDWLAPQSLQEQWDIVGTKL